MLERIMYGLFPQWVMQGTPYYGEWLDNERQQNARFWRAVFPTIALIYVGHYYFFDLSSRLQPEDLWSRFRLPLAGLCLATAALYCLPSVVRSRWYRLPAALSLMLLCYVQAKTILWYNEDSYMLAFIVVWLATVLLRTTVFGSLCFAAAAICLQWSGLTESGVTAAVALSASVGVMLYVATARAHYAGDIGYYLANQRYVSAQKRMIEMNIEFSDRIRSFLPKEISTRLTSQLAEADLSVPDAVKRVLTPATRTIACLFTDIRGFTKGTKGGDSFIYDGVIPNTSLCSALIEKYRGIPRKIGDLIFAYFDDPSIDVNLVRCLLAAFDIVEANSRFNRTNPQQISIRRYVLVATGNAEVGNLGGTDSSIEITAVGEPVDLLSRMDGLTKNPRFRERVRETDLILCPSTAARLRRMAVDWHIQRVPLAELDVGIRDFEEIDSVWVLATDDHNRRALSATERVMEEQRAATSAPNAPNVH